MEVSKVKVELDANIKALSDRYTELQGQLNSKVIATIKQLRQEKKLIEAELAKILGAIQAFNGCVQIVENRSSVSNGAVTDEITHD